MSKIGDIITGVANSAFSLIKDKTRDAGDSFIHEKVKKGISVSSKRVLNLTGTPIIIGYGITWLSKCSQCEGGGCINTGLIIIGLGIAFSVGMAIAQAIEGKKSETKE